MSETLIVIPVLNRPHRIEPVLESIAENTPEPHTVITIGTRNVTKYPVDIKLMPQRTGDYAKKINYVYSLTDQPYIFTGADDLEFHHGWLTAALRRMTPGIGVVGTNDIGNPRVMIGKHSTHSLVSRAYADEYGLIDRTGKILFEGYVHEYVDDELVGTAKHRNAWAFAKDSIVEHLHPFFGKAAYDRSYLQFQQRMRQSRPLYVERRKLWT